MNNKIIELELRARISNSKLTELKRKLKKLGKLRSQTKRLSVMHFNEKLGKELDVRVRITNQKSEVVIKSGPFSSKDRIEISQKINFQQFIGFVRVCSQLGFETKVGERKSFNYELADKIIVSLVSAGSINYVELEKMSSQSDLAKNNIQLEKLAKELQLKILNKPQFNSLCCRLSETVDWSFQGTPQDYLKLERVLQKYK